MKYVLLACLDTRLEAYMPPQAVNDMLDEDIIESNRRAVINGLWRHISLKTCI